MMTDSSRAVVSEGSLAHAQQDFVKIRTARDRYRLLKSLLEAVREPRKDGPNDKIGSVPTHGPAPHRRFVRRR